MSIILTRSLSWSEHGYGSSIPSSYLCFKGLSHRLLLSNNSLYKMGQDFLDMQNLRIPTLSGAQIRIQIPVLVRTWIRIQIPVLVRTWIRIQIPVLVRTWIRIQIPVLVKARNMLLQVIRLKKGFLLDITRTFLKKQIRLVSSFI